MLTVIILQISLQSSFFAARSLNFMAAQRKRERSVTERCTSGFYGHVQGGPAPLARQSSSFREKIARWFF